MAKWRPRPHHRPRSVHECCRRGPFLLLVVFQHQGRGAPLYFLAPGCPTGRPVGPRFRLSFAIMNEGAGCTPSLRVFTLVIGPEGGAFWPDIAPPSSWCPCGTTSPMEGGAGSAGTRDLRTSLGLYLVIVSVGPAGGGGDLGPGCVGCGALLPGPLDGGVAGSFLLPSSSRITGGTVENPPLRPREPAGHPGRALLPWCHGGWP